MSSTFGTPQFAPTPDESAAPGPNGPAVSTEPQELIDPNDPQLTSELLDVNTEGDAYAQPAPPPDGRYRVKLKLVPQKVEGTQETRDYIPKRSHKAPIQTYFSTGVEASIIDPSGKYDGLKVYDYWVSTYVGRDGSTKVSTILARLHRPDGTSWFKSGEKLQAKGWIDLFVKALAGEPEVGIETQWGWSCQACGEEADKAGKSRPREILGMHKFPQERKAGVTQHVPEMACQVNKGHGYSRAQVRIARFLSLDELKK